MKIRIIGKAFTVETVDSSILQSDGLTILNEGIILISDSLSEENRLETQLHEILHVLWDGLNIGYSEATEEKIVTSLAKGLFAFISDNDKEVTEQIFYGEDG